MLFYDFETFRRDPMELFMLRHGGLASHGGTVGVMIAIVFYLRYTRKILPELNFVSLMDIMVIPTAIVSTCIRMGNFINQEIIGTPTSVPWAVIFGHSFDGSMPVPRHPAQLYEAALYAGTYVILMAIWMKWKGSLKTGFISGIFFILVFGGRFLIEFVKEPQGGIVDESFLQIGQYLSIPFIILGFYLAFWYGRDGRKDIKDSKDIKDN
jgi:prolipoprotein diacylglyceryl transferase